MKKAYFLTALCICLMASLSQASIFGGLTKSGTTAAQFLKIQVGARAIGMGGAYVALANDASSIYWNPAGLTRVGPHGAVNFVHTDWLANTNFDFAAAVIRAGTEGTFGLSFTSLSMPDMKVRTEFEPEGTGEYFSALDLAMGLSYARQITDRFSIGFTGKYLRQQIWHTAASALAFDIGILFRTDFDWLTLGMSISNFGPKMQYSGKDLFVNYDFDPNKWGDNENIFANLQTDKWDLPLLFRFGLAMEILKHEMSQLLASVEARHPNDNTESISLGLEYGFRQWFFLRSGYQTLFEPDSERGLTLGMGLVYYLSTTVLLHFDYAYADWGRLTNVHRFSLEITF
ncbi:MAG: PorV/PorQ family protein [candidate division KSB1 bacterium]|nr:PorV/PorQ family protein [candidate division KSB1 bacterium]